MEASITQQLTPDDVSPCGDHRRNSGTSDSLRSQDAAADAAEVERLLFEELQSDHSNQGSPRSSRSLTDGVLDEDELFDIPEPNYTATQKMEMVVMRERAAVSSLSMRCYDLASTGVQQEEVLRDSRTMELRRRWGLTDGSSSRDQVFEPSLMEVESLETVVRRIREDRPVKMELLVSVHFILAQKRQYLEELVHIWENMM